MKRAALWPPFAAARRARRERDLGRPVPAVLEPHEGYVLNRHAVAELRREG